MISCGVPDDGVFFNGLDKPDCIAFEFLDDDFNSCLLLLNEEINIKCKTLSSLNINQGQIGLTPSTKRNLKAFIEWTKGKLIVGENPQGEVFPVANAMNYIRRSKAHRQYVDKSKTLSEAAKPSKLESDTKWIDWCPTFINYLRAIPGTTGVPLSYIIRSEEGPAPADDPSVDYLENYIRRANLNGNSYDTDNLEVHTYITHFIAGNSVAEAKVTAHGQINDGRADFIALRDHFEGIGINAHEIQKAQSVITGLYYSGEKKPHMWWAEFEKEMARAFAVYDKVEGRQVHSDQMKLRILLPKISADFLKQTKAALDVELAKVPMTLTYADAVSTFRNAVAAKYPPEVGSSSTRTRRIVNEVATGRNRYDRNGRSGRGRGGRGHHPYGGRGGRNGRGGRGRGGHGRNHNPRTRTRPDSWWTVGTSGKVIECHPLISYPNNIWYDIPPEDREKIASQRRESSNNRNTSTSSVISEISSATTTINGQQYTLIPTASIQQAQMSQVDTHSGQVSLPPAPTGNASYPPTSQVTIMGGRNEQASIRSRNHNKHE